MFGFSAISFPTTTVAMPTVRVSAPPSYLMVNDDVPVAPTEVVPFWQTMTPAIIEGVRATVSPVAFGPIEDPNQSAIERAARPTQKASMLSPLMIGAAGLAALVVYMKVRK